MESARLQREQTKSEPVVPRKAGAPVTASWPLRLNDAHSAVLRLDHPFGASRTLGPRTLQAKLTVNEPGDQYEQEADRVAEQVMRMPGPAIRLQRKCACGGSTPGEPCEECAASHTPPLQRQVSVENSSSAMVAPSVVHDVLHSPGQALDQSTRSFFEQRLQRDFSSVRVHTGGRASESARSVGALAYTVGNNVVFGTGKYAPETTEGKKLIAHELTHVVQQRGLQKSVQRQVVEESTCTTRAPHEIETSHSNAGFLSSDVTVGSGRITIADFGIDWRHVKPTAQHDPLLVSWLNAFETDDSYSLSIIGFSDCFGPGGINIYLRQHRAENVERMLGPRARSRVTFRGMQSLGQFLAPNDSVSNRARNRSVVIEFQRQFTFPAEEISVVPRRCGPDVTQWLVGQMNTNRNHPTIVTMREVRWPRYIPFFNIGWTAAALADFASLVRGGAVWDFKSRQGNRANGAWRARPGRSCPTSNCDRTVTICGLCFNYDVPGNIHFGWIGRAAALRSWLLHFGAGLVQPNRWTDDPKDAVAVAIGEAMWDSGADLCSQLSSRRPALNLDRTQNCPICSVP